MAETTSQGYLQDTAINHLSPVQIIERVDAMALALTGASNASQLNHYESQADIVNSVKRYSVNIQNNGLRAAEAGQVALTVIACMRAGMSYPEYKEYRKQNS